MTDKRLREVGEGAPPFSLPDQDGKEVSLEELEGKWVVLYFYPKDNTPGCTTEALDFTGNIEEFERLGAVILGVSPDSCESHRKFIEKKELRVTLLSDSEKELAEIYGVWRMKKMAGREYMGVVRTTYLIDPGGKVAHLWPRVKVKGHVQEVIETLRDLV